MKLIRKPFSASLIIFIVGTAVLATTWWVNGADQESVWLYLFAAWFVLYAAYEVFTGLNKRKDQ